MREHYFLPAARAAFASLTPVDQMRFDEIIQSLCIDPGQALPIKTLLDVLPVVIFRYNDGDFSVAYDLPDEATLRVWMIGKGSAELRPY